MTFSLKPTAALSALAILASAGAAVAQDDLTLRFSHLFPQTHYLWEQGGKVFTDKLAEATDGAIETTVFPAAQLGKDPLAVLQSGLADIVTLVPSYSPEKLPLTSVSELPGFHNTTCEGVNRLWPVIQDGGPLDQAEYEPLGIHVLFVAHQPTYKLLNAKAEVSDMAGLGGLKIRANGASIGNLVRSAGGIPISMPSGEVYDSLSRGTIDSTLLPYYTLPIYGLDEVVTQVYEGPAFGGGPVIYAMTSRGWDGLTEDQKALFTEAASEAQQTLCSYQDELEASDRQAAIDGGKIAIHEATAEDLAAWQAKFDEVSQGWADEMEAQGRPGQTILDAYTAAAE